MIVPPFNPVPAVTEVTAEVKYELVSKDHVLAAVFLSRPEVPLIAAIASKSASHACTFVPTATPKFVLAVEVFVKSDRLFDAINAPDNEAYAFNQIAPSHTFIALDDVSKYSAPTNNVFPSLSTVGAVAFAPK